MFGKLFLLVLIVLYLERASIKNSKKCQILTIFVSKSKLKLEINHKNGGQKMTKLACKIMAKFIQKEIDKWYGKRPLPSGVDSAKDIAYIDDGHKYHFLDIYRPEGSDEVLPVIVSIHGGGWVQCDKEIYADFCMDLTKRNFAVVNFSYRLAPEVPYYEQIRDTYAVLQWMVDNAKEYKLDLNNVFFTGDSAGAGLCAISTNIIYNQELQEIFNLKPIIKPKAICLNCGATHMKTLTDTFGKFVFKYIIGPGFKKSPFYKVADYLDYVNFDSPPVFFITGYKDFMRDEVVRTYEELKEMGIEVGIDNRQEGEHQKGHVPGHVYNITHADWPESIETNDAMCDFFKKHIS